MGVWIRLRRFALTAGVLAFVAGNAGSLSAQSAPPAPFPAIEQPATSVDIEVYYGVRKVIPAQSLEPIVPPIATHDTARSAEAFLDTLRSLREGTHTVSIAAANLLNTIAERNATSADSRQIILATYSTPTFDPRIPEASAPWLASRPTANTLKPTPSLTESVAASPTPTVVVIREPSSEGHAAQEPARGLFLSRENSIAFGVAAVALLFAIWARARSGSRQLEPLADEMIAPIGVVDPNAVQLMGQYNAGTLPQTAEKFEIGPTFHEEVQQKQRVEEQNNVAAVEFILNQNLALLAALNPVPLVVDQAGFALPEESETPEADFDLEVRGAVPAAG